MKKVGERFSSPTAQNCSVQALCIVSIVTPPACPARQNSGGFLARERAFQNRTTKKIYRAFVFGLVKEDVGQIDRPIGRSRSDFRRWTAQRGVRGEMREASTRYRVLGRARGVAGVGPEIPLGDFTYIEVRPLTGRTHQIRVHMKAINHPLVEDGLYTENLVKKFPHALGFQRLALHACQLEFADMNGKKLSVSAPLPEDFRQAEAIFAKNEACVRLSPTMEIKGITVSPVDMAQRKTWDMRGGDTVKVTQKIKRKGKVRLQVFEGIVLARKHGSDSGATFTRTKDCQWCRR